MPCQGEQDGALDEPAGRNRNSGLHQEPLCLVLEQAHGTLGLRGREVAATIAESRECRNGKRDQGGPARPVVQKEDAER